MIVVDVVVAVEATAMVTAGAVRGVVVVVVSAAAAAVCDKRRQLPPPLPPPALLPSIVEIEEDPRKAV